MPGAAGTPSSPGPIGPSPPKLTAAINYARSEWDWEIPNPAQGRRQKEPEGRVRWIASDPAFTPYFALTERDRGRLSYVAKVDITEQRERLPDGVPVEVEFLFTGGD